MQHFRKMCYNFLCVSASTISHKKPMDHIHTEITKEGSEIFQNKVLWQFTESFGRNSLECYMQR